MNKLFSIFSLSIFLFFTFTISVNAQVVINEFSSGSTDDWVELYNTGSESIDLSQYKLRDSTSSNKKDLSGLLSPNSFMSFDFSNYLNNDGDMVKLLKLENENEATINEIGYGTGTSLCAASSSESIGRKPDGSGSFVRFVSHTKDLANTENESICPTSAPTTTPTPNPTSAPTNTPTPTATPKPTPTKTPTPKASVKPTATPENEEPTSTPEVLGDTTFGASIPLATPIVEGTQVKNFPFIAVGMIVLGIVFIGIPIVWFWRQKAVYNGSSDESSQ